MKKKLGTLCLAGVIILCAGACGSKSGDKTEQTAQNNTENAVDANNGESKESADSSETELETVKVSEREDYVALQDIDISTYVTLPEYKKISVQADKPKVTDEDIENYINNNLMEGLITDRAVQEGDVVNIDYVGKRDGVAFQGGSDTNAPLKIGSGSFIPGFEEGLIGVMPKSTVDLNLTFPEGYKNEALVGVEVVFTVTVNGIIESAEYATVPPEKMEALGLAYKSKEELWEAGQKAVEEQAESAYQTYIDNAIIEKLIEESTITEIPDYFVEEEVQNYNNYMNTMSQKFYGMDLEAYVAAAYQMTMQDYNENLKVESKEIVKQYLIMEALRRAEKIEVTEELLNKFADEKAPSFDCTSGAQLIEQYGHSTFRMYMVQDLVLERLRSLVTVEETSDMPETQSAEVSETSDMPETQTTEVSETSDMPETQTTEVSETSDMPETQSAEESNTEDR